MKRLSLFTYLLIFIITASATDATAQIITTIAGDGSGGYSGDGGAAVNAGFEYASGIAMSRSGTLFFSDDNCHCIRKVDRANGIITTIAGTGTGGYNGDNIPALSAQLFTPRQIAIDTFGNLYIADYTNARIRKVDMSTGIITTVAGTGTAGNSGDGAAATSARINAMGLATDDTGNLYIADPILNHVVRKVNMATGIIQHYAGTGTGGYAGDGGLADTATLNEPAALKLDQYNNVYVCDQANFRVRKITAATGIITNIVGIGVGGYAGDGGLATNAIITAAKDVTIDADGNVYFCDYSRIRRIDALTGIITTIAGTYNVNYNGDGIPAVTANVYPQSAIMRGTNIFFGEEGRVREISAPCSGVVTGSIAGQNILCQGLIDTLLLTGVSEGNNIQYLWQTSADGINWSVTADTNMQYVTGPINADSSYRVLVTCTDGSEKDTTTVFTVLVGNNIPPTVSIVASPDTNINAGTLVTFTATAVFGGNNPGYKWQKNGTDISGATNSTYSTNMLVDGDKITCKMHSNVPCLDTANEAISDTLTIHIMPEGVQQLTGSDAVYVYPNPANKVVHLVNVKAGSMVKITDLSGRMVYSAKNNDLIDVSALDSGLYIISVQYADGTAQRIKLAVER